VLVEELWEVRVPELLTAHLHLRTLALAGIEQSIPRKLWSSNAEVFVVSEMIMPSHS